MRGLPRVSRGRCGSSHPNCSIVNQYLPLRITTPLSRALRHNDSLRERLFMGPDP